jgi:fluoroquinolone transport system permease protein
MRATIASFNMLLKHISRDGMLILISVAPLLMVVLFSYILPTYIEQILPFELSRYYILLDLMIAAMTPYLFCFGSSLAILEEIDDHIATYLSVTPVGKDGYLFSRLILPSIVSAVITVLLMIFYSLSNISIVMIVVLSISTAILAIITSMIVVCVAKNKVEGMAISKISGLLLVGLFIPSFITGNIQYLFGVIPSFWIAKLALSENYLYLFPLITCSTIWIVRLQKTYRNKL